MAQWIEHQGKKLLRMDVDQMTIEQYLQDIRDATAMVVASKPAPNSVLLLVCGVQPSGALDQAKVAWREFQEATEGLTRGQAVSGLSGFKRVVARLVRRDLYFASSEDDARAWLIKQ